MAMTTGKVEYVKSQKTHDGRHGCHWPGCNAAVPPAMWGCRPHWFALPAPIRTRIWRTYQPGQEISKTPSSNYIAAAREAQEWIAANHKRSVIVHGPLGCGKTFHAERLKAHFGLRKIQDEWDPGEPIPPTGMLVLTNVSLALNGNEYKSARVISFNDAMLELKWTASHEHGATHV